MDIHTLCGQTPAQLLPYVFHIARLASSAILRIYHTDFAIEHKMDNTPLTAADLDAHNTICKELAELTPGIPILSEESATVAWSERITWDTYWLVDPLDGTMEFTNRNGEFTVNIALIQDHSPVLGVVYVPADNLGYIAGMHHGAWKIPEGLPPQRINVRQTMADQLTVATSRSHSNEKQKKFLQSLGPRTEILPMGSSLKSCLVAEGKVDIYPCLGPTSEWDTAAGQCVVEQAGGRVTDLQFRSIRYNTKDSLLNPHFLVMADPSFDWKSRLDGIE